MSERGYSVEFKYKLLIAYKNRIVDENAGIEGLKESTTWKSYSFFSVFNQPMTLHSDLRVHLDSAKQYANKTLISSIEIK